MVCGSHTLSVLSVVNGEPVRIIIFSYKHADFTMTGITIVDDALSVADGMLRS
jgi:hypothetical protein